MKMRILFFDKKRGESKIRPENESCRKARGKRAALARFALNAQFSGIHPCDLPRHGKSQPRAVARSIGRALIESAGDSFPAAPAVCQCRRLRPSVQCNRRFCAGKPQYARFQRRSDTRFRSDWTTAASAAFNRRSLQCPARSSTKEKFPFRVSKPCPHIRIGPARLNQTVPSDKGRFSAPCARARAFR